MPGLKETKRYGPAPIGAFLNPSSPTFSTYFRGTIHAAPVAGVRVERHEVRPRLLEAEAHAAGIRRLDRGDLLLQHLRGDATVALERELHVVGREGRAIVKSHALAQHELIDQTVPRYRPRLGEARRHLMARHRLHEAVVERVEEQERRDEAGRLGGLEEARRGREVERPRHLPGRRLGRERRRARDRHEREDPGHEVSGEAARHDGLLRAYSMQLRLPKP